MALELTDANFQSMVIDSDKLTVVDFGQNGVDLVVQSDPLLKNCPKSMMEKSM